MHVHCPHCRNPIELVEDAKFSDIECPSCGSSFNLLEETITHQKAAAKTIGHFELVEEVGVGAFGSVWKARDTKLDRTVAVKIPRKGQLDPAESEQFLREARSAAQLKHPNIVGVHEVGRDNGQTYIVSDFIEGLPLSSWLTARQLTFHEAAELTAKIADALQHAHQAGVIHRDLKPSNIMLDLEGEPHIMDFGLAKREAGEITMTVDGQVLGTPAYMSPEQARGEAHLADRRSDVYSLGVVLFESLTGEKPFRGDFRMLLYQVMHDDAPSPRKLKAAIPRDLETICLRCLEKEIAKRYTSAKELADDLRCFLRGEPIAARPITSIDRTWRWCKRHPALASLLSLVASLLLVLAVGGLLVARRESAFRRVETEQRRQAEGLALQNQKLAESERQLAKKEGDARKHAERQFRAATAIRLAAQSQGVQKEFPVRGLLLAIEAIDVTRRHGEPVVPIAHETLLNAAPTVGGKPLIGHEGPVNEVAISADGRWLVTGSDDETARVWDLHANNPSESSLVLQGHPTRVSTVTISPNGRWVITASGAVRLWDLTAEKPSESFLELRGHERYISKAVVSPNSRWLVTGSYDAALLWDLASENPAESRIALEGHENRIISLAISPDSHWAVTGSDDKTARLWDLTATNPSKSQIVLRGHESRINSVAISPNGRWLATGSLDKTARLWDLTAADPSSSSLVLLGHQATVGSVDFSPDNHWLVTGGSFDRTLRLWDLTLADPSESSVVLTGHEGHVSEAVISGDSRWLVSRSADKTARLWDLAAEDPAGSAVVFRGHEGGVYSMAISPDGRRLITGSADNSVRVWNLDAEHTSESPLVLRGHGDRIEAVAISADSRRVVTGSHDHTARIWDLTAENPPSSVLVVRGHKNAITSVAVSPDGHWLATAGTRDMNARLWDLTAENPSQSSVVLEGHTSNVVDVAISSDSRWLATGGIDHTARVWDLTAQNPDSTAIVLRGHTDRIWPVAFSPDNRWVVTGSYDSTARLWDLAADNPAETSIVLRGHGNVVYSLAFSPDSRRLATGALRDKNVRLWDLTAKDPSVSPVVLRGHEDGFWFKCLAITPNGGRLVTGSQDNTARVWDLNAENASATSHVLRGHDDWVSCLALSPEAGWLATGSKDNTARLWDLNAKDVSDSSLVLRGHTDAIYTVAISPNGRWLVTTSVDGTARLWELNLESLIDRARRLAGRELTAQEKLQYLISDHHANVAEQKVKNDAERAESLVQLVLTDRADAVPSLLRKLKRLREHVIPLLRRHFGDSSVAQNQRLRAACALAALGEADSDFLTFSVAKASAAESENLLSALKYDLHAALLSLDKQAAKAGADGDWRLKARLALLSLHLGERRLAVEMCQIDDRPDPIQRTLFIDEVSRWLPDAATLATLSKEVSDPGLQSALCLAIGSIRDDQLTEEFMQAWEPLLSGWYQHAPDAVVHSSSGWALRKWNRTLPDLTATNRPTDGRKWCRTTMGLTMAHIPAGTFARRTKVADGSDVQGQSTDEPEVISDQQVVLTQPLLISDREISVELFQQFVDDPDYPVEQKPQNWKGVNKYYSPSDAHPVNRINWFDAVLFCNWLSSKEGLAPCYKRTGNKHIVRSEEGDHEYLCKEPAGEFCLAV